MYRVFLEETLLDVWRGSANLCNLFMKEIGFKIEFILTNKICMLLDLGGHENFFLQKT